MKEKLLTSGHVAEICQVSVPTVLNWIKTDLLPSYKTAGGHNRISPLGLLRFLSQRNMFVPQELYNIAGVNADAFSSADDSTKPVAIVADDDESVRSLIRDVLETVNYIVVEVKDGLEACLQMGLLRPDLLILDILMPEMDGLQVINTIKKQKEFDTTNIIIVSGALDDQLISELKENNIKHIMQKPVPITEFIRIAGLGKD
ncbi:MAG: response regulator [Planctomycetota bacterium]|jgi:CheY-like chemotaxis protein